MNNKGLAVRQWWGLLAALLLVSALACNLPLTSSLKNSTQTISPTIVAPAPTYVGGQGSWDSFSQTPAAPVDFSLVESSMPAHGGCQEICFTWEVTAWEPDPENPDRILATMSVKASGGNGVYAYYHADVRQPGPLFVVPGAWCRPLSNTLRVDSAGESAHLDYWIPAPCPEE